MSNCLSFSKKMIQTKRVYDPPAKEDGARFLVERHVAARDEKGSVTHGGLVQRRCAEHRAASLVRTRPGQMEGIPTTISELS